MVSLQRRARTTPISEVQQVSSIFGKFILPEGKFRADLVSEIRARKHKHPTSRDLAQENPTKDGVGVIGSWFFVLFFSKFFHWLLSMLEKLNVSALLFSRYFLN